MKAPFAKVSRSRKTLERTAGAVGAPELPASRGGDTAARAERVRARSKAPTASASVDAPRRPPKQERDAARRAEIVAAAKACVKKRGFHAASMAEIAAEAAMSVGQIYRYFDGKEAIIAAIVESIVERRLAFIAGSSGRHDLPRYLARRILTDESGEEAEERALLIEATAEAARNPAVAAIVREADLRLHAQAVAAVKRDHPGIADKAVHAVVEVMAVLAEGTSFRRVTTQLADPARLEALYRKVIEVVMPPASE